MQTPETGESLRVVGIAGSLRRGSYNRRLLRAAAELAPPGLEIAPFDLGDLPLYDADFDSDEERPEAVRRMKAAIAGADGVLFATPEYNHSIPGVLQNAIDWTSRPAMRSPLAGKPVAIMGAAGGTAGTARAQLQMKVVLLSTMSLILPHPGVQVALAREKFAPDGALHDPVTRDFLAAFLGDFERWIRWAGRPGRVAPAP